ncbi:hypothetical protein Q7P37_003972 [Cladosporium fusiforme]
MDKSVVDDEATWSAEKSICIRLWLPIEICTYRSSPHLVFPSLVLKTAHEPCRLEVTLQRPHAEERKCLSRLQRTPSTAGTTLCAPKGPWSPVCHSNTHKQHTNGGEHDDFLRRVIGLALLSSTTYALSPCTPAEAPVDYILAHTSCSEPASIGFRLYLHA